MKYLSALAVVSILVGALFIGISWQSDAVEYPTPYGQRADVREFMQQMAEQHNFSLPVLEALFAQAQQRNDIIERISKPAEKAWPWHRYQAHLVDEKRVQQGVAFWQEHSATLQRAADAFGVAPEYIVAILGVETRYGRITGGFRVLDALATLGFDYPPRSDFFRKQLVELLLLAREEGKDPAALYGSYAGAMGYGQFIPSSYRHYAVDFDSDGVRDIWSNPVDAIGSIANYFHQHHWQPGGLVVLPVEVPDNADAQLQTIANQSLKLQHSVGQLMDWGLLGADVPRETSAALYKMQQEDGDEYWLGLHNFYVITRYNRSRLYALAVHQLSQKIKQSYLQQVAQR